MQVNQTKTETEAKPDTKCKSQLLQILKVKLKADVHTNR